MCMLIVKWDLDLTAGFNLPLLFRLSLLLHFLCSLGFFFGFFYKVAMGTTSTANPGLLWDCQM
jgi:hypothetical protein